VIGPVFAKNSKLVYTCLSKLGIGKNEQAARTRKREKPILPSE